MAKKKHSKKLDKMLSTFQGEGWVKSSDFRTKHPRAKAVKAHKSMGRKLCRHCYGSHTSAQHRSHGKGAFARSGR